LFLKKVPYFDLKGHTIVAKKQKNPAKEE